MFFQLLGKREQQNNFSNFRALPISLSASSTRAGARWPYDVICMKKMEDDVWRFYVNTIPDVRAKLRHI